ncbi:hypothetical protein STVIR_8214 [Streptomyces viridochromogenes Tue57]|uniref:Uncharacterized protein n=1 Tax=Streptomyces viridochromogenes Tue57 TaxID=1160705 RepID=L8P3N7_STRVR|nr:hypothetical protein STVIR_8214 [Streptomyces viridochromogenes Tue57]
MDPKSPHLPDLLGIWSDPLALMFPNGGEAAIGKRDATPG